MLALARKAGFRDVRQISSAELAERYFRAGPTAFVLRTTRRKCSSRRRKSLDVMHGETRWGDPEGRGLARQCQRVTRRKSTLGQIHTYRTTAEHAPRHAFQRGMCARPTAPCAVVLGAPAIDRESHRALRAHRGVERPSQSGRQPEPGQTEEYERHERRTQISLTEESALTHDLGDARIVESPPETPETEEERAVEESERDGQRLCHPDCQVRRHEIAA